jgi:hypothetical protein
LLFMIVERFAGSDPLPAYARLRERGRQLPDGLRYVDSWIEAGFHRCFQLMECDDLAILQRWILGWRGAGVTFEVVPVLHSRDTRPLVEPLLDEASDTR